MFIQPEKLHSTYCRCQVDFSTITTILTCVCLGLTVIFPTCPYELCLLLSNLLPKYLPESNIRWILLPKNRTKINIWPPMLIRGRIKNCRQPPYSTNFALATFLSFQKSRTRIQDVGNVQRGCKEAASLYSPKSCSTHSSINGDDSG